MDKFKIILQGNPSTKKNNMKICYNRRTKTQFIKQNERYDLYEATCLMQLRKYKIMPIDFAVNVQCVYFRDSYRRVDLPNLINATLDILVKGKILEDDNFKIVAGTNGSRVFVDKINPRTEIIITEFTN